MLKFTNTASTELLAAEYALLFEKSELVSFKKEFSTPEHEITFVKQVENGPLIPLEQDKKGTIHFHAIKSTELGVPLPRNVYIYLYSETASFDVVKELRTNPNYNYTYLPLPVRYGLLLGHIYHHGLRGSNYAYVTQVYSFTNELSVDGNCHPFAGMPICQSPYLSAVLAYYMLLDGNEFAIIENTVPSLQVGAVSIVNKIALAWINKPNFYMYLHAHLKYDEVIVQKIANKSDLSEILRSYKLVPQVKTNIANGGLFLSLDGKSVLCIDEDRCMPYCPVTDCEIKLDGSVQLKTEMSPSVTVSTLPHISSVSTDSDKSTDSQVSSQVSRVLSSKPKYAGRDLAAWDVLKYKIEVVNSIPVEFKDVRTELFEAALFDF